MKDENGVLLADSRDIVNRRKDYFRKLLNVDVADKFKKQEYVQ